MHAACSASRNRFGRSAFGTSGWAATHRQASPATCGVAIDVPSIVAYWPFRYVLLTATPGAATNTAGPRLEKPATSLPAFTAATAIDLAYPPG